MSKKYRTRTSGELSAKNVSEKVILSGWVSKRRDHGKLIFFDLRNRDGIVQAVLNPKVADEAYKEGKKIHDEYVVRVEGVVRARPPKLVNPKIKTGAVEIEVENLQILSKAAVLPFDIHSDGYAIDENLRLKYRYLDLRRARMLRNLQIRQQVKNFVREHLTSKGFIEVDTPILTKATPEGARDFLVPSRYYPGKFYALPQSPQQYKQLLMVGGIEKYFQIPRCFRDEDVRADRLYEFDQIDIEMSFVDQEDIMKVAEDLVIELCEKVLKKKIQEKPFPRITYDFAMEKYHSDKPDVRKNKNDKDVLAFVWVTDFPLFEWHEEEKIWGPAHHPFTAPKDEDIKLLDNKANFGKIRAKQYDLALNGFEVFGGSIRITDPSLQTKIFEILGHSKAKIQEKFGHLLEAFSYGVPPHGGIASGFDRFLMAAFGEKSIREMVPFPTTGKGTTSVMDAPSEVDTAQLKELGLAVKVKKKKK